MENVENHPLLRKLSEVVEENLTNEQFGVNDLAIAAGMSRSNLHRKLQELTGQSVSQFIREYRLTKAMGMLRNEDLTASEVAYRVGFSSASYFSKSFNDYYGFPPGEARFSKVIKGIRPVKAQPYRQMMAFGAVLVLLLLVSALARWMMETGTDTEAIPNELDKSLVVLPFRNLSPDPENTYFADGVMEAIRAKLAGIRDLHVASRISAERYRDNTLLSVREIAEELNVTYLLEGSAQKFGSEVRVNAQLVDARNDRNVWSGEYAGSFNDILTLQSEIAEKIAQELEAVISPEEKTFLRMPPTINPDAYEKFILGDYQYRQYTRASLMKARDLYLEAASLDPQYADAYIGLGQIYHMGGLVWGMFEQEDAAREAKRNIARGLQLKKDDPEALATLGSVYFYYEWNLDSARFYMDKAKKLTGFHPQFALDIFIKTGQSKEAVQAADVLIEMDPLNSVNYIFKSEAQFFTGDTASAIRTFDEAVDLFDDIFILREAAKNFYYFGQINKSRVYLDKLLSMYPDQPPIILYLQAVHANISGEEPDVYLRQLEDLYQRSDAGSPAWFLAMYEAEYGSKEQMFNWLKQSLDRHEVEMTWLHMEPLLIPYRDEARYRELLAQMSF